MEQDIPFTTDFDSGYLALLQAPLGAPAISTGPHTLDVQLHRPGMHSNLNASRTISIVSAP
jgi:hypothetical protein